MMGKRLEKDGKFVNFVIDKIMKKINAMDEGKEIKDANKDDLIRQSHMIFVLTNMELGVVMKRKL